MKEIKNYVKPGRAASNKIYLIISIFVILSMAIINILNRYHLRKEGVYLAGEKIEILVVNNEYQKYIGLGGRNSLGEYDGMLFVYSEPGRLGVVMRDMLFPIDVVWFDNGEIVDIAPNLPIEPGVKEDDLKVYFPRAEANTFLELPAGWAMSHNLKIGDKLTIVERQY